MSQPQTPLLPNTFYHIYNRGINGCELFRKETNYLHFLKLYEKHIVPVASTFAWVLMGNHFHVLVKIKSETQISETFSNLQMIENTEHYKVLSIHKRINQQFSNLFNAYTKAFNKMYRRTGSLFETRFKRNEIDNHAYLMQTVVYIHNNPVHHAFCKRAIDYPWISYKTCVSQKETKLHRNKLIQWFGNTSVFIENHNNPSFCEEIKKRFDII